MDPTLVKIGQATATTAGSIPYAGTGGTLKEDNANLFFDDTNKRVGIGTATPGATLDVQSTEAAAAVITAIPLVAGDFTATGFTGDNTAGWTNPASTACTLAINTPITVGTNYVLIVQVTAYTGTANAIIQTNIGGVSVNMTTRSAQTKYLHYTATTTATPVITLNSTAVVTFKVTFTSMVYKAKIATYAGQELRTNSTCIGLGSNALRSLTSGVSNTGVGSNALASVLTGGANTGFGASALTSLVNGVNNVAVGASALGLLTSGGSNTAVGTSALGSNTTGGANVAIGNNALSASTTANGNVAVGAGALLQNLTGGPHIAIGQNALFTTTASINNIAIGASSMVNLTTGNNNTAVGFQSMNFNTTASGNVAYGYRSLRANTTGIGNLAVGADAMLLNQTGSNNLAVGTRALSGSNTASNNLAIGTDAMLSNTSGDTNAAVGTEALYSNTTGAFNVALGNTALRLNTIGRENMAIGSAALYTNNSGNYNIGIGTSAIAQNTAGSRNVGIGWLSLYNSQGDDNTGIGHNSIANIITGTGNVGIGSGALQGSRGCVNNTMMGYNTASGTITITAGLFKVGSTYAIATLGTTDFTLIGAASNAIGVYFVATGVGTGTGTANGLITGTENVGIGSLTFQNLTTGAGNVAIGSNVAYSLDTGSNNTIVGRNSGAGLDTGSNNTILGANVIGLSAALSNNIIIADGAGAIRIRTLSNGNTGVNVTTPTANLHTKAGTATAGTAPLKIDVGAVMTTAEVGAVENSTASLYYTTDTTSGRGIIPVEQRFTLAADGTAITTAAGNFFGANSGVSLEPGASYEIEAEMYFLKTTASVITWQLTNQAAPTYFTAQYISSANTGINASPVATHNQATLFGSVAATQTIATGSLTTAVNHYALIKINLTNNTATSFKFNVVCTSGTLTPRAGSFWKARKLPLNNTGIFAA